MKKHILIYESIEVGLKFSLNLILISELFARISIIWLHLRLMCELILFCLSLSLLILVSRRRLQFAIFSISVPTYMYEIKALHCGKCFLLFLSLIGMFMF